MREKHPSKASHPLSVGQERLSEEITSKLRPEVREEFVSEEKFADAKENQKRFPLAGEVRV